MDYEKITEEVRRRLSDRKFNHSKRAAEISADIARVVGCDPQPVMTAAILHDIASELSMEGLCSAAEKYDVKLTGFNISFPPSIHGKVGAAIAENELGINDKNILTAISNHVTGRPCMSIHESIVYVADHLARLEYENAALFEEFEEKTTEEGLYGIIRLIIEYDVDHGKMIDDRTSQTLDWLLEIAMNVDEHEEVELSEESLREFDEQMDRMIEFYREHMLRIRSVLNIREAGGYPCTDGRTVNKNMIVRSGHLGRITPADAIRLKELGINYVIDLRSEYEIRVRPDIDIPGITHINIPLCRNDMPKYTDKLMDWYAECEDKDEAAWLLEHYFDSMDMDKMYQGILNDPKTVDNLHDIIRIMLRDDCKGILIHCTSGKDRTGVAMAFILELLGVNEDVIYDDYFASQVPFFGKTADLICDSLISNYRLQTCKNIISVMSVDPDRIEKNSKLLEDINYHTDRIYPEDFGLTAEDIKKLKTKYSF